MSCAPQLGHATICGCVAAPMCRQDAPQRTAWLDFRAWHFHIHASEIAVENVPEDFS
jgi:hypothetical protein